MSPDSPPAPSKPSGKRDQILDATLILIGEAGYRGLSFKELAERCALTKQGVLHYFPSKERLLFALLEERDAVIEAEMLGLLAAGGFDAGGSEADLRAAFRESLMLVVEHMLRTPALIRMHVVLRAEATGPEHPARAYFVERDRATLSWLAERIASFDSSPEPAARLVLAMMLGLQQHWVQEQCGFDLVTDWQRALAALIE